MADSFGDIYTWLHDVGEDKLFRFVVYRRIFTPYEQEQKFSDESQYEDTHFTFGYIKELINLENGDYLIGFNICDDDGSELGVIEYYRLSEIRLSCFDVDNLTND